MSFFDSLFDDPLKLALTVGALAATGGTAAPALAGGSAAAGAGAAGTGLLGAELGAGTIGAMGAAAPASVSAGLLSPEVAAMASGAGGGALGSTATGLGLLGPAEVGAYGVGSAVPEAGLIGNTAGAYSGTASELAADGLGGVPMTEPTMWDQAKGAWDTTKGVIKEVKPYTDAVGTGVQVAKAMTPPKPTPFQAPPPAPMPRISPADYSLAGVSSGPSVMQDAEYRKRLMNQFAQNALGGR